MAVVCRSPVEEIEMGRTNKTNNTNHAATTATSRGGGSSSDRGCGDELSQRIRSITSTALAGIGVVNDNLYVAVGGEVKECKQVVIWALKNNPTVSKLVLVHVHRPPTLVPMMGAWFPINQLSEQHVRLYRQQEMETMDAILNEYVLICRSSKVQADKLVVEMDDVAKGLIKAIEQNGITKLIMGVSACSKKTKNPSSKTARAVWKDALPSCNIWFVYKEELLKTREATRTSSLTCSSSRSMWESITDQESQIAHEFDEDDLRVEEDLYHQLQQAREEASKFRVAAHESSLKLSEAQMQLLEEKLKAKQMERKYANVTKLRKQLEETAAREQLEIEKLRNNRDEVFQELELRKHQQASMEDNIAQVDRVTKDFKLKQMEAHCLISSLQRQRDELLQERDDAVSELPTLQKMKEESTTCSLPQYSEFAYAELQEVTQNFKSSFKIGQGAYGCVYKAFLRHTQVAIKILNPDSLQGQSEFLQEVNILSRVRHPHLISLIGACHENLALIYEFLPNGSVEDRLDCKGNTPPLTWQTRIRIIAEICSALIFLHSNKPQAIIHGDLKPANILLDANLVAKLGDFGISRLLQTNGTITLFHRTDPKGTPAYMDPVFMSTAELTPRSDIYSFGIVILRLLTGKSAIRISKEVRDALDKGNLQQVLDSSSGQWPYVLAQQLAHLGLRCGDMDWRNRPDLVNDVWRVLEPLKSTASPSKLLPSPSSLEPPMGVPSYFLCPIFQEIMQDPQVAADGYTYEAEAIRGWLKSGHNTSPVTNLRLPYMKLIPNLALRSSIQEWLQQKQQ